MRLPPRHAQPPHHNPPLRPNPKLRPIRLRFPHRKNNLLPPRLARLPHRRHLPRRAGASPKHPHHIPRPTRHRSQHARSKPHDPLPRNRGHSTSRVPSRRRNLRRARRLRRRALRPRMRQSPSTYQIKSRRHSMRPRPQRNRVLGHVPPKLPRLDLRNAHHAEPHKVVVQSRSQLPSRPASLGTTNDAAPGV